MSVLHVHRKFSDLNESWHIGRGQWMMHDSMLYDTIQGQDQGHETLKIRNSSILKIYLLHHLLFELASDCWFLN